jgi:predicted nuclease of restriction endonuclease-like RecB superfamily
MERDNYRLLLSTNAVYSSEKEAEEAGKNVVREVKGIDLGEHVRKLQESIPKRDRKAVGEIVGAAE